MIFFCMILSPSASMVAYSASMKPPFVFIKRYTKALSSYASTKAGGCPTTNTSF